MKFKKIISFIIILTLLLILILIYSKKNEIRNASQPYTQQNAIFTTSQYEPPQVKNVSKVIGPQIITTSHPQPQHKKNNETPFSKKSFDEQFCFLKKNYPELNLNSSLEFQITQIEDNNQNPVFIFHINDNKCPKNFNSILKLTERGEIISFIDCLSATKTDLFLSAKHQYNIDNIKNDDPRKIQVSMAGYGYLLVTCHNDSNFYITRKGSFKYSNGLFVNEDGCTLTATDRRILRLREPEFPDPRGCFENGETCMGIVDPQMYNSIDFEFINKEYTKFNLSKYNFPLNPQTNTNVFNNAKEDRYSKWSNDFGIPNWDLIKADHPPSRCD